jgi:hypothetical protein
MPAASITPVERDDALAAFLARNGRGRVASNDQVYNDVIRPALTGPQGQRADVLRRMWSERNDAVGQANRAMVGGYGSALNSARQQDEEEWLRKYNEQQAKMRGGGGRSGGGGGGSDTAPTTFTTPPPVDPYAWLDEYMSRVPTAPAPPSARPRPRSMWDTMKPPSGNARPPAPARRPPTSPTRYS